MNKFTISVGLSLVTLTSACEPISKVFGVGAGVEPTLTIACGIANVVVGQTESAKIKENFGEDSFTDKVCELFLPGGTAAPSTSQLPLTQTVVLPDGAEISAEIVPSN